MVKTQLVALLTESVDWNVTEQETVDFGLVALLTESVDWNQSEGTFLDTNSLSLSSRRAWIEILKQTVADKLDGVALLTESVDWNFKIIEDNPRIKGRSPHGERGLKLNIACCIICMNFASLSSRRAWIEIVTVIDYSNKSYCRSPHGERGLKWIELNLMPEYSVALLTESVDWNSLVFFKSWNKISVALLTESVDWNNNKPILTRNLNSRSPHGERGLKLRIWQEYLT